MEVRRLLMAAYSKIFSTIGTAYIPKYNSGNNASISLNVDFEKAVMKTFLLLAPVMSDGVTTENLTMLRTRFVLEWMENYAAKYPFSLFSYHDKLLRDGQFEAYNQWLFGKAENVALSNSWNQFNPDALAGVTAWMQQNEYHPTSADFYNTKEIGSLFPRRKSSNSKKLKIIISAPE